MSRAPSQRAAGIVDTVAAWLLAILWILPLLYAVWTAFHPAEFSAKFSLLAPLTLENFARAWQAAPFARYLLNTTLLVTLILCSQLVLCTLASYAFVRYEFRGKNVLFALVLVQLMIMPDILLVENYKTMSKLGLIDTLFGIGLPYFASAFAIFFAATNLQKHSQRIGGSRHDGGRKHHANLVACLRTAGEAGLRGVRVGFSKLPLEQFSLATCGHQLG
jgi:ABC-type glycerol-3-phosphate transport system permease component